MRKLLLYTTVILGASALLAGWFVHEQRQALERPMNVGGEPLRLLVPPGARLVEVAEDLRARGVLEPALALVWYARFEGLADKIKAGEYEVPRGATPLELLDLLVSGKVIQWPFTIVEGWTFRQLRAAMAADPHLVHTLDGHDDEAVMARLGHAGMSPEGWFYPDTYHFPRGTTDLDFLKRAMRTMQERLEREWAARSPDLPYLDRYEALILASIVEKETAVPEERGRIAGVFVRRLQKGMRLAADPTVIYGLGESFDGNLTRRDLKHDTPYNTYVRRGLPPTPIAMTGGDALRAALNPEPGDELFFVAKGDGSHHFSPTYEEHRKAIEAFQLRAVRSDPEGVPSVE